MQSQYVTKPIAIPKNGLVISLIVVAVTVLVSIVFGSYTLVFLGIIAVGIYLMAMLYIDNTRNINTLLNAILSKLYESQSQTNSELHEIVVDGVTLHIWKEEYIKYLEARKKN